ncbi:uncharacterized protein PgNI_12151 [Pyricularia grisea]|uniref:Uncharacterized protein n=1 Tax=Pyricularia grisea TaxID=148305 RepID=A0A6P8AQS2_PYRGI|nr:uncharacterized protein PgNI_12151 [Pyricularia grisea]TLD04386.1 hypothetical protein PgNI_12151 [Pyricularia grisea]
MSFRVKERGTGVQGDEGHIITSFEDSVFSQVIRTPSLKRSSTSNDNPTQTYDFRRDCISSSQLRSCDKAVEEWVLVANPTFFLPLTAHRHPKQPGWRAEQKVMPAVFVDKKLVCRSNKQVRKWPTLIRKTSTPTALKSVRASPAPDIAHNPSQILSPTSSNTFIVPRKRLPPGLSTITQFASAYGSIANGSKTPRRGPKLHLQLRLEL